MKEIMKKKKSSKETFSTVLQIEKELWKNIFTQEAKQKKKNQLKYFLDGFHF